MDEILRNILASLKNILIVVICVGFLGAGMLKLVELPSVKAEFLYWNFPIWSMYLIGLIEVALSIGVFYKPTRIYSLFALIGLMCSATLVHLTNDESGYILAPLSLSFLCVIIIYLEKIRG
ncbi:MAG TPA: DoxX family protein [Saprospiraceae bacterium]|nr:DoxX family protein [Saprospiraceae bacterium]